MAYLKVPLVINNLSDGGSLSVVGNGEAKCKLGESPLWCNSRRCLFWIDISGKFLFRLNYTEKGLEKWNLEKICPHLGRPCCLALCKSSRLLIAFEDQFAFVNPDSSSLEVEMAKVEVPEGGEWDQTRLKREGFDIRLNDGRVHTAGNLLIGGINETFGDFQDEWEAVQPCYHVSLKPDSDGKTLLVSVVQNIPLAKITNSICFSPDGSKMYHTDTPTKAISVFPFGDVSGGEVIITTENSPDGSVIDAKHGLWNAEYEGGVVNRYEMSAPEATVNPQPVMTIAIPAKQTTCPCIGGPEGNLLFVTSASNFSSAARYDAEPLAGHVFIYELSSSEYYVAENLFNDTP